MARKKIKVKLQIISLLLIGIAAFLALLLVNDTEKYIFTDPATYYCNGEGYEIEANTIAKLDKENGNIFINFSKEDRLYSRGLPAYYSTGKKVVLLNNMSLVTPYDTHFDIYKLIYFTEVENESNITENKISKNSSYEIVNKGFLFDGNNTYVFLEPVSLKIGDDVLMLGPLSYVIACRNNYIEIYDIDTDYHDIKYGTSAFYSEISGMISGFLLYPEEDYVTSSEGKGILLSSNVEGNELLK